MKLKLFTTEDGSISLSHEDLNETYHSSAGAISESDYVYILQGLAYYQSQKKEDSQVNILEVGFGTGLNAWLTYQYAMKHAIKISYHTLEPFPIAAEFYKSLNYCEDNDKTIFLKMHEENFAEPHSLSENIHFCKYQTSLENFETSLAFDLIYFDAFAPSKQPEIWNLENIEKCFYLLALNGCLVTYCAQGNFKRNLKEVGFEVETLPGALHKKEMVRAIKR